MPTSQPLKPLFDSYLKYYAQGSSHTARAKRLDINHFLRFLLRLRALSKAEKLRLSDWDHSSVQRFVEHCLKHSEAPATVARRLATLKHMGRTLSEKITGFVNPAREVKTPKVNTQKPKALSAQELNKVRAQLSTRVSQKKSFGRFRNRVIFELMLETGLRAEEARLLKYSQLDEKLEWLKNVRTKGKRYRNVYINSKIRDLLKEYLVQREVELTRLVGKINRSDSKNLALFISGYSASLNDPESFLLGAKTLWRAINELSTERKLHPHLLRHSFALDLLEHSNDIRLVAQALGHSDVRTTMRYTERKDEEVALAIERKNRA